MLNKTVVLLKTVSGNSRELQTFIFWRTNDRLRSIRNVGRMNLPEPRDGEYITYVLDGQQRITSLFASLKGVKIKRENKHESDYSKIYIDLKASDEEQLVITDVEGRAAKSYLSINDLLSGEITFLATYPPDTLKKIEQYRRTLDSYDFSIIEVKDARIDVATEIFTRINVGGKALNLYEIMVAKTYDSEKPFDLSEKFVELLLELQNSKYETIPAITVLQTLSVLYQKDCTRKDILKIPKDKFIEMWVPTVDAIKQAIDYFRTCYEIPVSRLLPYNALIIPFSYYFYKNKEKPTGDLKDRLQDFFWRASLGARYSSGVESKLVSDIDKIDKMINGQPIKYEWPVNTTAQFIEDNGWFATGRSYIKAILAIYSSLNPLSFEDNSKVIIDNSWLKIASSKNYHHFFPKAYLKNARPSEDYFYVNHIANITIVDDQLNKVKIKAKAPSKYIGAFAKKNKGIDRALKTHLIAGIAEFGIDSDDYDMFFKKRIKLISKEMEKRVILTDADNHLEHLDDDQDEETEEAEDSTEF